VPVAGRETRAAPLRFRAGLRHAPSWVVDDRDGHNKKIGSSPPRVAGRRCVVAWLSLPIWHLEYRHYPRPGNTLGNAGYLYLALISITRHLATSYTPKQASAASTITSINRIIRDTNMALFRTV